ncbi:PREDICTED: putative uncharacterized protein DDB_G0282133 isoform X1 [Eufriesea mexicana]|uniref:putative uncharacterized protein DDB_G0282133 isoform X1 n=1 Tax=Eufriesea mexicana TaxID=516756 RepID=UPI00083C8086|nr:PREDICTED: putative uncharacterized protein DDB_G0282133 isoform X1 [Eufriesea mexicana]
MSKKNRKRKLEEEEQSMLDWEQENIFPEEIRNEMESMWEIPQIFHFLHLAKEALNIPHLSMYEMERMFLIPRASKQLANIMTSLLSSPMTKAKLRKIPPMPYEFWTNILAYKMKSWFKIYEAKHQNPVKVLETIGVEPEFWNVFPDAPLLNGKDFEELTFKQKVWLLKTVCDTVMHTRKTVQEEIAKQPWEDQFETILGTDRYGAKYIYFPQFLKSDLRIYRHCLDNKILSTVKPIKPKLKVESENKVLDQSDSLKKQIKHRRKKRRWRNGLPPRSKKKTSKCDEKHLNDCKFNSDSATGSLINEDTNFSSTSNCSNNNNSSNNNNNNYHNNNNNENNINLDTTNVKRSRSPSKCSEISTASDKACKSTKSSGYDTNNSIHLISGKRSSQRMFKGFSSTNSNDKYNLEIISGILSDLKSETGEEKSTEDIDISLAHVSQNKLELNPTKHQYLDTVDVHVNSSDSIDRTTDTLSNTSKTDDEKLNEIISAENFKFSDKSSDNTHNVRETQQVTVASKSDDEKLNETRTNVHRQEDNASFSEEKENCKVFRRNGKFAKRPKSDNEQSDQTSKLNEIQSSDDKDLSLSELRSMLQKEAMENDFSFDEDSEIKYNLRKLKSDKIDEWKQEVEDFNAMLSDLSVSKFQLVADTVNSLRDLISTFSQKNSTPTADTEGETEFIPPCEVKLVIRMTELLSTLEEMESALRDSMKKARGKLQKEWTNFKEGSAEDQDSSGEGLGSNWWVLGSQGYQLPTSGDTTLQTLPQSTISSTGSQNICNKDEKEPVNYAEHSKNIDQQCRKSQNESSQDEAQGGQSKRDESIGQENARIEEETKKDSNAEEQQTRRVLRARGISSYTEQFYSDDEIEENELEEWTDVEAVYAAPSTQSNSSTSYFTPKIRHGDDRTNEEDSDQDWILPSSRKRKNKRPSANRRLKSFQHKLQNIKVDTFQDAAESKLSPSKANNEQDNSRLKEIQISKPKKPSNSEPSNNNSIVENQEAVVENNLIETVPSMEINCKVENVASVHSELDIKDEGPIYDSTLNQFDNSYTTNLNSNYVMLKTEHNPMNYYVMQSNPTAVVPQNTIVQSGPIVSSIIPPIQQGYYVQGGQNYIIQNSQSNFLPPQPFPAQGPQMIAPQQFVSHSGYVPYMVTATQPQPGYITTDPGIISQEIPQNPSFSIHPNSTTLTRPPQNRYFMSRQNYPHPNGAVIRSSMPIRGNTSRTDNARVAKNVQQQRNTSVRMQKPRKPSTPPESIVQKTTSLIVLSDSDDEIEMIITEKNNSEAEVDKTKSTSKRNTTQPKQKPMVTSNVTVSPNKGTIPPQIIQRMNQGGISITPVKTTPPVQNSNTQLVVVVNETGSHYALALPNGSKLILTPEQVAQIRASNGGKLIL